MSDWSNPYHFTTYPEDIFIEPFDNSNNWTLATQNGSGSISEVTNGMLRLYSDGTQHWANARCSWQFNSIPTIGWEVQVTIDCPINQDYHNDSYIYDITSNYYVGFVYKRWSSGYAGLWVSTSTSGSYFPSGYAQVPIPNLPEQIRIKIVYDANNLITVYWKPIADSDWTFACTKPLNMPADSVMYVILSEWDYGTQWTYFDDLYIRAHHVS